MAERLYRAQILLEPEQHRALKALAEEQHRSLSDVARETLKLGLEAVSRERDRKRRVEAVERMARERDAMLSHIGIVDRDLLREVREDRETRFEEWADDGSR